MIPTITQNDGSEVLRTDIGDRNPNRITVAVLNAIDTVPKPRKPRSDTGRARVASKPEGADAQK